METIVELSGVCKRYRQRLALDEVSLAIGRGEVVGVLGSNGAGKSTLLRIITGLVRPTCGEVRLFQKPPNPSARSRIGALIERADAYPYLTGAENLEVVLRLRGQSPSRSLIEALLDRVGVADAIDQVVRTYSYGMRQRLGLAMALAGDPELVILDEPVNGLDPRGIADVRQLITSLHREGKTVIISSHLLSEVELVATRLVVLRDGRIIADGALEELLSRVASHATIETVQPADVVVELLNRQLNVEKIRPHAVRIAAEDVHNAIVLLVGAGISIRAVVPERSLEQFYFAATT
jgi:ABC-2 type transport system ATP-binding protein